jgi:hypothetical protein
MLEEVLEAKAVVVVEAAPLLQHFACSLSI